MTTRTTRVRNERLAEAMARKGIASHDLSALVGIDPRTVQRLVDDRHRIPRAATRFAIAKALDVPAAWLWPTASNGSDVTPELIALYPNRPALPAGHVMSLLAGATEQVDVLAFSGIWLWDAVPDFGPMLARKAGEGVRTRVCLGDPSCDAVRVRGSEEGIGDLMRSRCELALSYAQRWLANCIDSLRVHDTTLYASILRFDDEVLLNWHLYGSPASESPVLHMRRMDPSGITATTMQSFERVWATSKPLVRGDDEDVRPRGTGEALTFGA